MAKRQHLTVEEVLKTMQVDFEDDPDEPMMEGSNDEFSDLKMSDSDNELDNPQVHAHSHTSLILPETTTVFKVRTNLNYYYV